MNFTTQVPIPKSSHPISYHSKVLSLGSCFAEHMAGKLRHFGFESKVNPYGILFHPPALEKAIGFGLSGKVFSEKDLFFHNERWQSYDLHSALSQNDPAQMAQNLNAITADFQKQLRSASHLVLTLGTAWAYRETASGNLVANCHKVPQKEFSKELLAVASIKESLSGISQMLLEANPNCRLILTISPVRHLKDGFTGNQRSKAHLIAAVHEFLSDGSAAADYFPSYELLLDELRDYRFYADDLLHPSQMAVDYLWQRFAETYIEPKDQLLMQEVAAVRQMLAHRPFDVASESYRDFTKKLQSKITALKTQIPQLDLG